MTHPATEREDGRPNLHGRVWVAQENATKINIARVKTELALDHDGVPTDERIVDGDALAAVSATNAASGEVVTAVISMDAARGAAGLMRKLTEENRPEDMDGFRIDSPEPWKGGIEIKRVVQRSVMKVTDHAGKDAVTGVFLPEIEHLFGAFLRNLEIEEGNAEIDCEIKGSVLSNFDAGLVSSEELMRRDMAFAAALLSADGAHHVPNTLRWACENFMHEALRWNDCEPGSPLEAERDHFLGLAAQWRDMRRDDETQFEVPSDEAAMPHWPPAMRRWLRENADMSLVQAAPLAEYRNAGMAASGAAQED